MKESAVVDHPVPHPPAEWAGTDMSSMPVIGPLKRAHAALEVLLESLFAGAPVGSAELDVMVKLRVSGQPTIAVSLARQTGRSGAAVSKLLNKLERRGLIVREPSLTDRRAALTRLTDDGVAIVDKLFPAQLAREARGLESLDPSTREQLSNALTALAEALESASRAR